jgi:hypothetical protein
MTESEEAAYVRGRKAVLREQLGTALRGLGGEKLSREELIQERADAIAALREVCDDHGDNDWEDNLYLPDIITKHLADYFDS